MLAQLGECFGFDFLAQGNQQDASVLQFLEEPRCQRTLFGPLLLARLVGPFFRAFGGVERTAKQPGEPLDELLQHLEHLGIGLAVHVLPAVSGVADPGAIAHGVQLPLGRPGR